MADHSHTIFHNPRCSKSRQTLQLLMDNGIDPAVRLYLEDPPSADELAAILKSLGISARDLLRSGEDEYRQLNLADSELSDDALIAAMVAHPRLIERPIVIRKTDGAAVLGRPPQNALEIIE